MNHTHDRYADLGVLATEPADLGPLEPERVKVLP